MIKSITDNKKRTQEEIIKCKTCCFTGHRPNKLPWRYNTKDMSYKVFVFNLQREVNTAVKEGYMHFITGMAEGVDMICAREVIYLKTQFPFITLECAIPCRNQYVKWNKKSQQEYNEILSFADKITYVTDGDYVDGCMQKRNRYMVDNSSMLIAGYNGDSAGGTFSTVAYAKKKGLTIIMIKP